MSVIGQFKMSAYLDKLYESAAINTDKIESKDGIIIPDENKKSYDWLKQEYKSAQQSVKVDIKLGGDKFKPCDDMQAPDKTGEKFVPGIYGNSVPASKPKSGKETDFKPTTYGGKSSSNSSSKSEESESKSEETESKAVDTAEEKDTKDVTETKKSEETTSEESESDKKEDDKKRTDVNINN